MLDKPSGIARMPTIYPNDITRSQYWENIAYAAYIVGARNAAQRANWSVIMRRSYFTWVFLVVMIVV